MTSNKESLLKIAESTVKNNQILAFNLSATFLIDQFMTEMDRILQYCDYMFGNEDEVAYFAKVHGLIDYEPENTVECYIDICDKIQSKFPKLKPSRTLIVTRGPKEVVVNSGPGNNKIYEVPPVDKNKIKDSNGAGDSFVGGFLSQIAIDKPIESALKAGMFCSAQVLQQVGCNFPNTLPDPHSF